MHLMARTATLNQAGGLHRMALKGHSGPIRKVLISPDGQDVFTASDDGYINVSGGFGACRVQHAGFNMQGLTCRIQRVGFTVQYAALDVQGVAV